MEKPPTPPKRNRQLMRYTGLGMQILVYLAIGVYGGLRLDKWLHTNPLMIILLPALALFLALLQLYRQLTR